MLFRTDNMSVESYINRQGGVHSRALYEPAARLLLWADHHLLSILAAHIPGLFEQRHRYVNRGTGSLTENGD